MKEYIVDGTDKSTVQKEQDIEVLKKELEKGKTTQLTFSDFFQFNQTTPAGKFGYEIEALLPKSLEEGLKKITEILKTNTQVTTLTLTGEQFTHKMLSNLIALMKVRPDLTLVLDTKKIPTGLDKVHGHTCHSLPTKIKIKELECVLNHEETLSTIDGIESEEDTIPIAEDVTEPEKVLEAEEVPPGEQLENKEEVQELRDKVADLQQRLNNRKGWMRQIVDACLCCIPLSLRNCFSRGNRKDGREATAQHPVTQGNHHLNALSGGSSNHCFPFSLPSIPKFGKRRNTRSRIR